MQKALLNHLPRPQQVGSIFKLTGYFRLNCYRVQPHIGEPWNAAENFFEWRCDEGFYFCGRQTTRFGLGFNSNGREVIQV
jgi:hypothetical protein